MLILTRRVGETLMIGDEVSVTVLGVKGNQVRIGVNAPKEVAVHVKRSISAFSARRSSPSIRTWKTKPFSCFRLRDQRKARTQASCQSPGFPCRCNSNFLLYLPGIPAACSFLPTSCRLLLLPKAVFHS